MFDGCLKLQKLFPPFSGGLLSLKELSLSYCRILEIHDFFVCLTTLQELDLSGTMIESIRRTIKQSSELSILNSETSRLVWSKKMNYFLHLLLLQCKPCGWGRFWGLLGFLEMSYIVHTKYECMWAMHSFLLTYPALFLYDWISTRWVISLC